MKNPDGDSDEEKGFWENFEQKPILLSKKLKVAEKSKPKDIKQGILLSGLGKTIENREDLWKLENFENTTKRIQESNKEETRSIGIRIKNKTCKEMRSTVLNISKQFQEDVIFMKKDQDDMQQERLEKNKKIQQLIEDVLFQNFIEEEYHLTEPEFLVFENNQIEKNVELKKVIQMDNLRFEAFKTLNTAFKEEAGNALNKVKMIDSELEKIKNDHNNHIKALESKIGAKEKIVVDETSEIKQEFEAFKLKITQEMQIRTMVVQRQGQFIKDLITELKNAKIILQNPTLRMKTYEKLKETATPTKEKIFPKIIGSQLSTKEEDSRMLFSPFEMLSSRSTNSNRRAKSSFKY